MRIHTIVVATAVLFIGLGFALPASAQWCPPGTVNYAGVCFVEASAGGVSHATTCAAAGLLPTAEFVTMTWDANALNVVATGLGHTVTSGGCCAVQAFCNASTDQCLTDNFGSSYQNWEGTWSGDPAWANVYTCEQTAAPVAQTSVPTVDPRGLAVLAAVLGLLGILFVRWQS